MPDGSFAPRELVLPLLWDSLTNPNEVRRRFEAAGCTHLRIRRAGKSLVVHGFTPELDARVTHPQQPSDLAGEWYDLNMYPIQQIPAPAQLTAYRRTAIQHLR